MKKKLPFSDSVNDARHLFGRILNRVSKPVGTSPGTLIHTGDRKTDRVTTRFMDYDLDHVDEGDLDTPDQCAEFLSSDTCTWIDTTGLHDVGHIEQLGGRLGLHPLMLEDILSPGQRPKFEEYEENLFIVLRILSWNPVTRTIAVDQCSLVLGNHFVATFLELPSNCLDPVRERIHVAKGRIRRKGCDYLMYAIVDAIVDDYFHVLEAIGDEIEALEDVVMRDVDVSVPHRIHALKREILILRKCIWPLREVLGSLYRSDADLIQEPMRIYLRDVHDHLIQAIDTVETLRDLSSGLLDTYISSQGNRMNEVMKVLTIIATIFIPLTFLAGIYGMNFESMPELKLPWAYPVLLLVMFITAMGMVLYFRRKRWL